jgi:hypothetical protein
VSILPAAATVCNPQRRKVFFFEKKKQKTFARLHPCKVTQRDVGRSQRRSKSFLPLFFKKEDLPSLIR